jgi:hypothetical protein
VLDSGCTNHMTREKVTPSYLVTIVKERYLCMVKLLSIPIILFLRFYLLILWTRICCQYHNFVRWATNVCSLIKLLPSLGGVMAPILLVVS